MFTLSQKTKLKKVQLNVSKGYCGSESYVTLDDLNIDVKDGEFVNMETLSEWRLEKSPRIYYLMKKREVDLEPQYSIEEDRKGKGKRTVDLNDVANIVLFLAAFVGIWQLVFTLGIWPKVSMPSPAMVAESFVQLIQNITLITSIGMTMWRLAIGFAISITIGVGIGLAMVKFTGFGKTMSLICGRFAIFSKCGMGAVCNLVNWS